MFFLKRKKQFSVKKPIKKWKKVTGVILIALFVISASYIAYLYASGKRIFDSGNLTASPFFKKISGREYSLKGEGDGRINVLFLGMGGANHPGGQLTDSIMVISIDPDDNGIAMLSIPRDLYVPVPNKKYSRKINEIYKIGEDIKKGQGGDFAKETVGKILDLPIHYYVTVDFYGFKKLVDEVGGVDVYVDKAIYDSSYPADDMIHFDPFYLKAGEQHLDGKTALKYARSRHGSSGGDFDRAARQQKVISSLREKILDKGYLANPKKILDMVDIIGDHVRTDFTPDETMAMGRMFKDLNFEQAVNKVLSNGPDGELISDTSSGTYTLIPKGGDWEIVQRLAHEIFTDPNLKKENAGIEVANCTNISGQAAKLADSLKSYNYTIVSLINGQPREKTAIFDYSNGSKRITLEFLENRLNVKAEKRTRPADAAGVDISIQIGDDYKGFAKDPENDY